MVRHFIVTVATVVLALVGHSLEAAAQEWSLTSNIAEKMLYEDNVRLSPDNPVSSFGSLTTPQLALIRQSPTSLLKLVGRFPYQAYFGHSELNSFDQHVQFVGNKDLSERSTVNLGANFDRTTNIRSETDDTENFSFKKIFRTSWGAAPSWNYLLSPIDSINLGANYQDVSYDSNQRVDYRSYGTGFSYSRQLNELSSVTGQLTYGRFEPDVPTHRRTNVFGSTIGYRYTPSERFTINSRGGLSYDVTTEDGAADDKGLGFLFHLDFRYQLNDRATTSLTLDHDSEPSGSGRQTIRNRANVSLDYRLTELTKLGLDARYTDNEDYLGTGVSDNSGHQKYFSIEPSVSWRVTEDLSLVAEYNYRHKTSGGGTASSNGVFLTLRYAFPDLMWGGM